MIITMKTYFKLNYAYQISSIFNEEEGRGAGAQDRMGLEGYGRREKKEKKGRRAKSPRGRQVVEKFKKESPLKL